MPSWNNDTLAQTFSLRSLSMSDVATAAPILAQAESTSHVPHPVVPFL